MRTLRRENYLLHILSDNKRLFVVTLKDGRIGAGKTEEWAVDRAQTAKHFKAPRNRVAEQERARKAAMEHEPPENSEALVDSVEPPPTE